MKFPFYKRLIVGAACVSVILLWLCAASVYVHPSCFPLAGVVGLGFPFFLAGVLFMLFIMLLFTPRQAWIPLAGMALAFFPIRDYCPLNIPSVAPEGAIKVMTYNTAGYGNFERNADGKVGVAEYIRRCGADIVCLQEAYVFIKKLEDEIVSTVKMAYPHYDTVRFSTNVLSVYSRYPIVGKRKLSGHALNGSAVFELLLASGDTLRVVNCHLESMRLSPDDRKQYSNMVRNPEDGGVEAHSRRIVSKIANASVVRAQQARQTAEYLEENRGKSILLCGDFNDSPISYTHHRFVLAGLTDSYSATGLGVGRTFNRDAIYVRIDNMMHSEDWEAFDCHIDRSTAASDHYPVYAYYKRKEVK